MNVFFERPNPDHPHFKKIRLFAEAFQEIEPETMFWHSDKVCLFDFLSEKQVDALFFTSTKNHMSWAKEEYPDTKFVYLRWQGMDRLGADFVVDLTSKNNLYADYSLPSLKSKFFEGGIEKTKFKSEVTIVTDGLGEFNPKMMECIADLGHKKNLKIFGNTKLPSVYYLGKLKDEDYRDVIASTKNVVVFEDIMLESIGHQKKTPILIDQYHLPIVEAALNKKNTIFRNLLYYQDFVKAMLKDFKC